MPFFFQNRWVFFLVTIKECLYPGAETLAAINVHSLEAGAKGGLVQYPLRAREVAG